MGGNGEGGLEVSSGALLVQLLYYTLQGWDYLNLKVLAQANILFLSNPTENLE